MVNGDWNVNQNCPSCHSSGQSLGPLFEQSYFFGSVTVPLPPNEIALFVCDMCTLVYKNIVPSPDLMVKITGQVQDEIWHNDYDYEDEIRLILAKHDKNEIDMLDIGAADGRFLKMFPGGGRRSALDIERFDGLEESGEFIRGFLDWPELDWSGHPYDTVTVLDVLEHLYDPQSAMRNLHKFLRDDGFVVIETGDSDQIERGCLTKWNYLNGPDHHIAWNRKSLEVLAQATGFSIRAFETKSHKLAACQQKSFAMELRYRLFRIAPNLLRSAYSWLGKRWFVPGAPAAVDHFRAVLVPV